MKKRFSTVVLMLCLLFIAVPLVLSACGTGAPGNPPRPGMIWECEPEKKTYYVTEKGKRVKKTKTVTECEWEEED